ncbi:hypothetical protein AAFF_G00041610 [Aldrovandia affinis]|uniref:Uncharacterized protein n=1 Tax=Aldrovandia affinis TaxID=143900 RepID=A0AAD7S4W0_9TELE|nr:hypothetical protein AAFF_G00041610 [Aldrovandia affinis]
MFWAKRGRAHAAAGCTGEIERRAPGPCRQSVRHPPPPTDATHTPVTARRNAVDRDRTGYDKVHGGFRFPPEPSENLRQLPSGLKPTAVPKLSKPVRRVSVTLLASDRGGAVARTACSVAAGRSGGGGTHETRGSRSPWTLRPSRLLFLDAKRRK